MNCSLYVTEVVLVRGGVVWCTSVLLGGSKWIPFGEVHFRRKWKTVSNFRSWPNFNNVAVLFHLLTMSLCVMLCNAVAVVWTNQRGWSTRPGHVSPTNAIYYAQLGCSSVSILEVFSFTPFQDKDQDYYYFRGGYSSKGEPCSDGDKLLNPYAGLGHEMKGNYQDIQLVPIVAHFRAVNYYDCHLIKASTTTN